MNICDLQTGDIILISNYEKGWFNLFLDMIRLRHIVIMLYWNCQKS